MANTKATTVALVAKWHLIPVQGMPSLATNDSLVTVTVQSPDWAIFGQIDYISPLCMHVE